MSLKRIPFDGLCLSRIVLELRPLLDGRVQRVVACTQWSITVEIYAGTRQYLLISWSPPFARIHLVSTLPDKHEPSSFVGEVSKRLVGTRLTSIKQRGKDRLCTLSFSGHEAGYHLEAELIGAHANLILVGGDGRIVTAARRPNRGVRNLRPGTTFEPIQPSDNTSSLHKAAIAAGISSVELNAHVYSDYGAYPLDLAALGYVGESCSSLSEALETTSLTWEAREEVEQQKRALIQQLQRVALSREAAKHDLELAADTAARSRSIQEEAELILAYASTIPPGSPSATLMDYNGDERVLKLNPDLSPLENAERRFQRAKHAKLRAGDVAESLARITDELALLNAEISRIERAGTLAELSESRAVAERNRWLHRMILPTAAKEERPYEGHSVREATAPGNWQIIWGENATSNDYVTHQLAKPNDYWFHVRGATSAHVILRTNKQPEKVQPDALRFAASLAVRNSSQKHAKYVPVDYCLKKYVRKPRGAKAGSATYTHEKTLFVDGI